jgi:hypothetical protein
MIVKHHPINDFIHRLTTSRKPPAIQPPNPVPNALIATYLVTSLKLLLMKNLGCAQTNIYFCLTIQVVYWALTGNRLICMPPRILIGIESLFP